MRNMIHKNYIDEDEYYTQYPFHHWIRSYALVGHTDTILCDLWCKNTCSVFLIMSKIGTGPQNQMMKLNTLAETPIIQEDRDQDGVYQPNKDMYLNFHFLYIQLLIYVHRYVPKFRKYIIHVRVFFIYEQFTANIHMIGKWLMVLYNIPFLLIQNETSVLP